MFHLFPSQLRVNHIWSRPIAVILLLVNRWMACVYGTVLAIEVGGVIQGKLLGKLFLSLKKSYKEETIPLLNLVMFHVTPGNSAVIL